MVTASGEMLNPLVVFKGKAGACIETREFPTYPADNAYACQETAWMDERVMLMWVRTIPKPIVEDCPINIQPLLLLVNSYKCHTMASVTAEELELWASKLSSSLAVALECANQLMSE